MADSAERFAALLGSAGSAALPPGWTANSEERFQRDLQFAPGWRDWRRGFMERSGGAPNVDPGGDYDYRRAWMYGVTPSVDPGSGEYHGLSSTGTAPPPYAEPISLKAVNHPTAWMEAFMQAFTDPATGQGIDPGIIHQDQVTPAMTAFMRAAGLVPSAPSLTDPLLPERDPR